MVFDKEIRFLIHTIWWHVGSEAKRYREISAFPVYVSNSLDSGWGLGVQIPHDLFLYMY